MKLKSRNIDEATAADAKAYAATSEQFIFCIDWLGISAHQNNADDLVMKLEERFEAINWAEGTKARLEAGELVAFDRDGKTIATMIKTGDRYVMRAIAEKFVWPSHDIDAASDADRVAAHWAGFCDNVSQAYDRAFPDRRNFDAPANENGWTP